MGIITMFFPLLSLFSDVRAGEGGTVLLLFLNAFLMMGLYYTLKPVREGLILSGFGAVIKSYSSAAQALLLLVVVPAYGAFAARVNRVWLLSGMTLFFISNLLLFIVALGMGLGIVIFFFIWVGILNFMVVSQFWAFANDVYTEEQGKRLFPVVGVGASGGALLGTLLTASVFDRMSNAALMSLASVLLGLFIVLIVWVKRRETAAGGTEAKKAEEALSREGGFGLVMKNRYLLLVALRVLILNLVNTVGEFILGSLFAQHAIEEIGAGEALHEARSVYYPNGVRGFLRLGQLRRPADPGRPRLPLREVPGCPRHAFRRADRVALRLRDQRGSAGAERRPIREGRRERERLLDEQHGAPGPVPAQLTRGQVQGQGRHRHVLRPYGRRPPGGGGVRGDPARPRPAGVRRGQCRHRWCLVRRRRRHRSAHRRLATEG